MYKIPAKTLFLGKNLIFVPECHSTNDLAQQLSGTLTAVDGSVIITDNQTAGRGQRGNVWLTEPGKNFTFSVLLNPMLSVRDQFYLTVFVSLGMRDYVTERIGQKVQIKWPNDIMVGNKKVAGILIENQLTGGRIDVSIIGIGLNVNQSGFPMNTATSLSALSGHEFDLNDELGQLLWCIEVRYFQLKERKSETLRSEYISALYRLNELHKYASGPRQFHGRIVGVDDTGRLLVDVDGEVQLFGSKEIQYIL